MAQPQPVLVQSQSSGDGNGNGDHHDGNRVVVNRPVLRSVEESEALS
jgi:hypothetical protein